MGRKVNLYNPVDPSEVYSYDETDAAGIRRAIASGLEVESPEATASRAIGAQVTKDYSGAGDKVIAGVAGAARGLTLGGSDLVARALDADLAYDLGRTREANPGVSTVTEIGGAILPALLTGGESALASAARLTPAGLASRAGAAITGLGEGAGTVGRIGAALGGGAAEGALYETGAGISDLALANDQPSIEKIASTLSHRALFGGVTGGFAGGALSGLELGLGAARRRLAQAREAMDAGGAVPADLAALDRKGLREAEGAELARIEAERVPQRQQLVDDFAAYREVGKVEKPWEAVATGAKAKDAGATAKKLADKAADAEAEAAHWEAKAASGDPAAVEAAQAARVEADAARQAAETAAAQVNAAKAPRWMREQGKIAFESDKAADRLLRNPKALAERPGSLKAVLQQEEHALEESLSRADELKVIHATDTTGRRAAALERIPARLERNRALQERIAQITATPASERLAAIKNAVDELGAGSKKTLGEKLAGGAAYGTVAGLVHSVPVVGPLLAPLAGAAAADAIAAKLSPALLAATKQATERGMRAIDAFVTVTKGAARVAPKAAPVLASEVLANTRFAPLVRGSDEERPKKPRLQDHFRARAMEIASQVEPTPDGPKVAQRVRAQINDRLSGLAAVAPHLADRLETHAVARLEYLAAILPRTTQIGMTTLPPDELAMRSWARSVAAADDPAGIEERLADGTITPEDAEVMRVLYPGRLQEITQQIMLRLGELRSTLPYHRRLALSILTGVPVDASMEPTILAGLQASFATEPGTEGGTQAPRPEPAFGSLKRPEPTPAQRRAG